MVSGESEPGVGGRIESERLVVLRGDVVEAVEEEPGVAAVAGEEMRKCQCLQTEDAVMREGMGHGEIGEDQHSQVGAGFFFF